MIKVILFDFDGVLTVDATGSMSIINYISQVTGIEKDLFSSEYRKYNYELLYGKATHEEVWENICKGIKKQIDISVLYDSFINTPLDLDMLELVKSLKFSGYKTGIITDNKKDRIDDIVAHYHFNDIFDYIIVSAEIGSGKDNIEIFENVINKMSVNPEECIFIDNSRKNLIIPNEIGMKTIFYDHDKRELKRLNGELKSLGLSY